MINDVHSYEIYKIFDIRSDKYFSIPKYQREYTWGKKEWEQLFNDIIQNGKGYFLGSVIWVKDNQISKDKHELIDGQQRLTTLSIFLLAIVSKLKDYSMDYRDDEDLQHEYFNLKNELYVTKEKIRKPRLELQVQNFNKDDYESLLYEQGILKSGINSPKYCKLRRIYSAFNYFLKKIDEYLDENSDLKQYKVLFDLADKFNECILVGIEVDSHKDAYMLFESLNNRGVPLSAVDLIKNLLISVADGDGKADQTYEEWKYIVSNLGDNYATQERFFRQFYNAFREELNEPYKDKSSKKYELGLLATRTTILDIYEKLIKDDYQSILDKLKEGSILYSSITNNNEDNKLSYQTSLENLERIQGAPSYLLILYLMKNKKDLNLDDKELENIIELLVRFFVRRNVTDTPSTRNLTKLFMELIDKIKSTNSDNIYELIRTDLIECSADDVQFETKLRGPIYQDNDMATRFILCTMESKYQTKEIYSDFWSKDRSNKFIWTIEHIFPEGQNIPKDWVDMIANGNKNLAQEYLNEYVHTLGNLTLTGYNQNLSNLSFEKKMSRVNKSGKDVGYKNGLKLNDYIVKQDKWTIENIQERTDQLVNVALDLFKL